MPNQTIERKIELQEVIPPPIIFETRGHRSLENTITKEQKSHCPQCGYKI